MFKTNVLKTEIDHDELNKLICDALLAINNTKYNLYIFMNEKTADQIYMSVPDEVHLSSDDIINEYKGYKVFINNDLGYGVVEVR